MIKQQPFVSGGVYQTSNPFSAAFKLCSSQEAACKTQYLLFSGRRMEPIWGTKAWWANGRVLLSDANRPDVRIRFTFAWQTRQYRQPQLHMSGCASCTRSMPFSRKSGNSSKKALFILKGLIKYKKNDRQGAESNT